MSYAVAIAWGIGLGALAGAFLLDNVAIGIAFGIALAYGLRLALSNG